MAVRKPTERAGLVSQIPSRTHSSNLTSSHEAPSMILQRNKAVALTAKSLKCPFCSQGSRAVKGTMADGLKPECPVEVRLSILCRRITSSSSVCHRWLPVAVLKHRDHRLSEEGSYFPHGLSQLFLRMLVIRGQSKLAG